MYIGAPALKKKLEAQGNVRNVGAVIGAIGRKKYGAKAMGHAAALSRKSGHSAAASYMKGLGGH